MLLICLLINDQKADHEKENEDGKAHYEHEEADQEKENKYDVEEARCLRDGGHIVLNACTTFRGKCEQSLKRI
jgi:hypothetical protein